MPNNLLRRSALCRSALPRQTFEATCFHHQPIIQRPAIQAYAHWQTNLHAEQPTSKVCLGEADLRYHPTPSAPYKCPLGNKRSFQTTYFEGLPRRGRPTSPSNAQRSIHMPVGEQTFMPNNLLRRSASARQTYVIIQRPAFQTYARWGTNVHAEQPTSKVCLGEADLRHHPTPSVPYICPLGNKRSCRTTYFEGLPYVGLPCQGRPSKRLVFTTNQSSNAQRSRQMPLGGQTLMPNNLLRRSALRRSALPRQTFEATCFHHQPIIQRPAIQTNAPWGTNPHAEQPTSKVCPT